MKILRFTLFALILRCAASLQADVAPLTYHPVSHFSYDPFGSVQFVHRPGDSTVYGISSEGGDDGYYFGEGTFFKLDEKGGIQVLRSFPIGLAGRPTGPVAVDAQGDIFGLSSSWAQDTSPTVTSTLYRLTVDGTATVLHTLTPLEGTSPAGLVLADDGNFYGLMKLGGQSGFGTFFQCTPAGQFTVLHEFTAADRYDMGAPMAASDGNFYGLAGQSGPNSTSGLIYRLTKAGAFSVLYSFDGGVGAGTLGSSPKGKLAEGADGALYGTLTSGGPLFYGCIFRVTKAGVGTVFHALDNAVEGYNHPYLWADNGDLFLSSDGNFYGMTNGGGPGGNGALYQIKPDGTFAVLRTTLYEDRGILGLAEGSQASIVWACNGLAAGKVHQLSAAGVFSEVAVFKYRSPMEFASGLVGDGHGIFYGTMTSQGVGNGSVFRMDADGRRATLHAFTGSDGSTPEAAPCLGTDGNLYGTTSAGGDDDAGVIYRLTPDGAYTRLHSFSSTDGAAPRGRLLQASDGHLYGTTSGGGSSGAGTIFRYTSAGLFSVVHEFNGPDGRGPVAGLSEGADGALYGTTETGGPLRSDQFGGGIVFRITKSGLLTVLYAFNPKLGAIDGFAPTSELLHLGAGVFYGTTSSSSGYPYVLVNGTSPGTIFKITARGVYTRVANLTSLSGPATTGTLLHCDSGLVKGADGALYGTTGSRTKYGSSVTAGIAFRVGLNGQLEVLHLFDGASAGTLWRSDAGDLWGLVNGYSVGSGLGNAFVLSPGLLGAKGNYTALLSDAGKIHAASGRLTLTLTAQGGLSGRLEFAGIAYPVSGKFDELGDFTKTIPRGLTASPLTLTLHLNVEDAIVGRITGTVSAGAVSDVVDLSRAPSFAAAAPSQAGRYTLLIDCPHTAGKPGGHGFGTLVVSSRGAIIYSGVLPDLAKFSGKSYLRTDGTLPFYAGIYSAKARGSMRGDMSLREIAAVSDGDAVLAWDKPQQPAGLYAGGLSTTLAVAASRFATPPPWTRILTFGDNLPNAGLSKEVGLLTAQLPFSLLLNNTAGFAAIPSPKPTLGFNLHTGVFIGTVPGGTGKYSFWGAVFQKTNTGAGLYSDGSTTSGIGLSAYP